MLPSDAYLAFSCIQLLLPFAVQVFDKAELVECIRRLVEIDQEWVPYSTTSTLYIRPTMIATEVSV